jgi:hypothetical protein
MLVYQRVNPEIFLVQSQDFVGKNMEKPCLLGGGKSSPLSKVGTGSAQASTGSTGAPNWKIPKMSKDVPCTVCKPSKWIVEPPNISKHWITIK